MMTYAGVIYAIKNTVTGDYYIGQYTFVKVV